MFFIIFTLMFYSNNLTDGINEIRNNNYDKAEIIFNDIDKTKLSDEDKQKYLFYLINIYARNLNKDKALDLIKEYRNIKTDSPKRYEVSIKQIENYLLNIKEDSLKEISHNMRVSRDNLKNQNEKLNNQEDILGKLDKLIQDEENKKNLLQKSNSLNSVSPSLESLVDKSESDGKVDIKEFNSKDSWGNLPFKQRESALQEIDHKFPPHYKDVIEEYFKTLNEKFSEK